jgi:vacuolar-type H+-ATPase subunit I/STV1
MSVTYRQWRVPSPEEFWEIFTKSQLESQARYEKWDAQLEREKKEREAQQKAWDSARKKEREEYLARQEKLDKQLDKLTKDVGGLRNSIGEMTETLIAARLWEKFSDYPYNLKRAYQRVPVYYENNQIATDIDILLSNTEWVMAVEVKNSLHRMDEVDNHIRRMELIRKYPPLETVGKRLVGAMAGGVVKPEVRDYIHSSGFFVLELTGETVSLVKPAIEFTPREW